MKNKWLCWFIGCIFLFDFSFGQVTIVSTFLSPGNVSPKAMMECTIMNAGSNGVVINFEASLTGADRQELLKVELQGLTVNPGLTTVSRFSQEISRVTYGNSMQAQYLRTHNQLPSGKFEICVKIYSINGDESNDQYCDEIESDFNLLLNLVYPFDKDTIYSFYPLFVWNHNLPFELSLTENNYFRMVVTDIKEGQGADQAILVNQPILLKDFLNTHQVQYPFSAQKLEEGHHYAWQVQQLDKGVVINRTETWEFIVNKDKINPPNKYAVMKSKQETGFYTVSGDLLLFKFDEEYKNTGNLISTLYDSQRKVLVPVIKDDKGVMGPNLKRLGDNRYEINLEPYHLKNGFYTLEVMNEKREKFYLQFNVTY